ncbi:hypothetical protein PoB_005734700 [Plakobranchus ocellatus]|uniref:Uncharacterized protein n=1 Tax=Plakobranchus ocellatus TaxID=259542 RepID=A0AAV4CHR0_9GAST|nr:hypothetical protein PoB_005734700 [Plakobranchus ocellatus]
MRHFNYIILLACKQYFNLNGPQTEIIHRNNLVYISETANFTDANAEKKLCWLAYWKQPIQISQSRSRLDFCTEAGKQNVLTSCLPDFLAKMNRVAWPVLYVDKLPDWQVSPDDLTHFWTL